MDEQIHCGLKHAVHKTPWRLRSNQPQATGHFSFPHWLTFIGEIKLRIMLESTRQGSQSVEKGRTFQVVELVKTTNSRLGGAGSSHGRLPIAQDYL